MVGWTILTILVLIAIAAPRYGADSRDVGGPPTRSASLGGDLVRVWHAVGRRVRHGLHAAP